MQQSTWSLVMSTVQDSLLRHTCEGQGEPGSGQEPSLQMQGMLLPCVATVHRHVHAQVCSVWPMYLQRCTKHRCLLLHASTNGYTHDNAQALLL